MKKMATNTLATLVLVGVMSLSAVNVAARSVGEQQDSYKQQIKRLERVYQHHDRKFELRASVLGVEPTQLREQLKIKSIDTIIKKHGFRDRLAFYTAVTGKLKDELRRRGWSERKIEEQVQKRLARLSNPLPKTLSFSV